MPLDRIQLGKTIRQLRKAAGLSQERLGEKLGLTNAAISQFELATSLPGLTTVCDLADVFGVTVGRLLGESVAEVQHSIGETLSDISALTLRLTDQARRLEEAMAAVEEP